MWKSHAFAYYLWKSHAFAYYLWKLHAFACIVLKLYVLFSNFTCFSAISHAFHMKFTCFSHELSKKKFYMILITKARGFHMILITKAGKSTCFWKAGLYPKKCRFIPFFLKLLDTTLEQNFSINLNTSKCESTIITISLRCQLFSRKCLSCHENAWASINEWKFKVSYFPPNTLTIISKRLSPPTQPSTSNNKHCL